MQLFDNDTFYATNDPTLNKIFGQPGALAVARCKGRGPAFHRVGNRIFYAGRDLNAYLAGTRVEPQKETAA